MYYASMCRIRMLFVICVLNEVGMDTCIAPTGMGPGHGTGWHRVVLPCNISLNTSWYCIVELIYSLSVHRCLMLQSHLCHIVLRHIAALGGALLHTRMQAMHCCIAMGYRYWCCIIGVHCAGLLHHAVWFCNCA